MVFNITPGNFPIKSATLYKLFKQWMPDSGVSRQNFYVTLHDYIPGKRGHFKINEKDIKLSQKIFHNIIENKKQTVSTKLLKQHMEKYFEDNKLERGKDFISADQLHEEYWTWCYKTKKRKRVSLVNFINVMRLYFEVKKNQHNEIIIGINSGKKEEKTNKTIQK